MSKRSRRQRAQQRAQQRARGHGEPRNRHLNALAGEFWADGFEPRLAVIRDFGELRSLLSGEPSKDAFLDLLDEIQRLCRQHPDRTEQEWLPYIVRALERWPAEFCRVAIPSRNAFDEFTDQPWTHLYRGLDLSAWRPSVRELEELAEAKAFDAFGTLGSLSIAGGHMGRRGIRALTKILDVSRTESLDVSRITHAPATFGALLRAFAKAPLRHLRIASCELTTEHVDMLIDAPFLPRLEALDLSHNGIRNVAALELLMETATSLTSLGIAGNTLTATMLSSALSRGFLPGFINDPNRLELSGTRLDDELFAMIAKSSLLAKAHAVELDDNQLTQRAISNLTRRKNASHIRTLTASNNPEVQNVPRAWRVR